MQIDDEISIPLPESDEIKRIPLLLTANVPSILMLNNNAFEKWHGPFVVVLPMDEPIILKGTCAMMIGDVVRTIREFFPEVVKFGGEVCSNLGTPEKYS